MINLNGDKLDTHDTFEVAIDAFSNGQIDSKIWLCESLEKLITSEQTVWIYGGWCGVLSFLLLSRNILPIKTIRSFDVDEKCEYISDRLLENWKFKNWKFKSITADCNKLDTSSRQYGDPPSLIINTSSEHFESKEWFDNIPFGTLVAIQSNDMVNDDHFSNVNSVNELRELYPLSEIKMSGSKEFTYSTWKFTRYMIIGIK